MILDMLIDRNRIFLNVIVECLSLVPFFSSWANITENRKILEFLRFIESRWPLILTGLSSYLILTQYQQKSLWIIFKRPNIFYDRTVEYVLKDSIYVHHEFNKSKHMSDFQGLVRLRFGRDCLGFIWVFAGS